MSNVDFSWHNVELLKSWQVCDSSGSSFFEAKTKTDEKSEIKELVETKHEKKSEEKSLGSEQSGSTRIKSTKSNGNGNGKFEFKFQPNNKLQLQQQQMRQQSLKTKAKIVSSSGSRSASDIDDEEVLDDNKGSNSKRPISTKSAPSSTATDTPKESKVSSRDVALSTLASNQLVTGSTSSLSDEELAALAWRKKRELDRAAVQCSLENKEGCLSCGS